MKLEQAARQALEALETKGEHHSRVYEAITALREALDQDIDCPCGSECIKCSPRVLLAKQAEQGPVRKCDGLLCNDCGEYKQRYKDLPGLTEKDLCVCDKAAPQPVKQEPVTGERCIIVESCKRCPHSFGRQSCALAERAFDEPLKRSTIPPMWCPLPLYAAPVRTKDLTDDEIISALGADMDTDEDKECFIEIVRLGIAAHKEKNK